MSDLHVSVTLECKGVTFSYDGLRALREFSFAFPQKGIVAIVGPNGAGKTTLLNVITGLLRPETGSVLLGADDISGMPAHRIVQLGVARTFQDLRLITRETVMENVLLACSCRNVFRIPRAFRRENCDEANMSHARAVLRQIGISELATEIVGHLSYGQQKLLSLACSLATGADILFLDEPVAGVAPEMREGILERLRKLCLQGKLVVFVEHDIAAVEQIAETVVVMDEGRLIAEGHPKDVLHRPEIISAYVD